VKSHATYNASTDLESLYMPSVANYLLGREDTTQLREANKQEQLAYDIDFYWSHVVKGRELESSIEVKVDGQIHRTDNFAFETVSNKEGGTAGCFLRSEADEWYYLSAGDGTLYRWRQKPVREWFLANQSKFRSVTPQTPSSATRRGYTSTAHLVPVKALLNAGGASIKIEKLDVPTLPEWYLSH